jgi:lyso-ornithine lipid O-acyltransferase
VPIPADLLRFPARSAGFVGLTFTLYGMLEVDTALAGDAEREAVLYKWMQRYGKGLLRLYGMEVRARGPFVGAGERYPGRDERGRGRIFVMNHRSLLDVFVTLAFIEATIVSRADLAGWPVIGVAARRVGTLFVDRTSKESGSAVVNAMCGAVERGRGVMVYPEGTTFVGDEVHPFRAGAFTTALRTGAEIVPVGLAYGDAGACFGDEPFPAHLRRISSSPTTHAALVVGAPLEAAGLTVEALAEAARTRVQELVLSARRLLTP